MTDWTLVTFDIDGTLLKAFGERPNACHRDAFAYAGVKWWGENARATFEQAWDSRPSQGATDGIIVLLYAQLMGVSCEEMTPQVPAFFEAMAEYFTKEDVDVLQDIRPLEGVKEALDRLATQERVAFGLVTGNVEQIAWSKMKALGLPLASTQGLKGGFGGFGSDVMPSGVDGNARGRDRGEQILKALEKATKLLPEGHQFSRKFHVGDTHADIDAAHFADAIPIGVTTGKFSCDELQCQLQDGKGAIVDAINSDVFWNMIE